MKLFTALILALNIAVGFCINSIGGLIEKNDAAGFVRLHIRASGDSEEEQALKLEVRDGILGLTSELLSGVKTKAEAMKLVGANLELIKAAAERVTAEKGTGERVTVRLTREYFERREYEGFFLPAGTYDSLIVEIGSGEGHNWWCVIFPAVCLSGSFDAEAKSAMSDGGVQSNIYVNLEAVPQSLRLAEKPSPKKVRYELWIVKTFKDIFGIE